MRSWIILAYGLLVKQILNFGFEPIWNLAFGFEPIWNLDLGFMDPPYTPLLFHFPRCPFLNTPNGDPIHFMEPNEMWLISQTIKCWTINPPEICVIRDIILYWFWTIPSYLLLSINQVKVYDQAAIALVSNLRKPNIQMDRIRKSYNYTISS